ncbi:hypothetical protein O3G_MSEX000229 [Manduca sexta]|nr:hypothetical protein O3G_MSEX000229 [Manduca sexta]
MLSNVSYEPTTKQIIVANKSIVDVICSGDLQITTAVGNKQYEISVNNVLCVPVLTTNLLSVSRIILSGNRVVFNKQGCFIYNSKNICIGEAKLENEVYRLNTVKSQQLLAATVTTSSTIWHRRLGHINANDLNKMKNGLVEGMSFQDKMDRPDKSNCTVCCEGKQARLPFPLSASKSQEVLELIHTDLCGPMENKSLGHNTYFLIFVDDYSRMCFVYFLQSKHQTFKCFREFQQLVENQQSKKIKALRSDNGGEFCSSEMESHLKGCGIVHQKSIAYTPEQNGLSERYNRSIIEKARCLLFDAQLDKSFWAEAVNTAVYLKNRLPASALGCNTTPYEKWTGKKPDLSHLRIFGSSAMVHIPKQKRKKWDKKATQMLLVGYSENTKGYRLYDPDSQEIVIARDVIIMEKVNENLTKTITQDNQELNPEISVISEENQSSSTDVEDDSVESDDINDVTYVPSESVSESDSFYETDNADDVTQETLQLPKRVRRQPDYFGFGGMACMQDVGDLTLEEALRGRERQQWLVAVQEELRSFNENDAWELVDAPDNGTIVQCKWVLRKKYDSDNKVRYRARLVAKGFSQKKGVDYTETFSPVVRHTTLRLLFSLSVKLKLTVSHLDVKTAFLNGNLEETIYMQKPDCFDCNVNSNKVLKLKKAIYGLKQASRAWNKKVDVCLQDNGYKKSQLEPCMYIKNIDKCKTIVTVYVDDFFIFSNDKTEVKRLKEVLASQFNIKDLGIVKQCLGMNVNFSEKECSVTLNQENYIDLLLERFQMTECKTIDTPMDCKLNINKGTDINNLPYQQLIGSLMYLSVLTRPDITFCVNYLSQFNTCHTYEHWGYAKRVLRYLKKTKSFGISYFKDGNSEIKGFVDADWANNKIDRRSYTGYCFVLSNGVISWECKKQKTIALSSTEAEYMGMSEACKEALYLRNLQFEITNNMYTVTLYNDNQSAQRLSENPLFHKNSKHIDVKYHFCRECVANKIVKFQYMQTSEMPADVFTKALCAKKHYIFIKSLGLNSSSVV